MIGASMCAARVGALIVCVNYSDILRQTLPRNRAQVDWILVVTTPYDHATIDLCADLDVGCCLTNSFHAGGAPFNKGSAINIALRTLDGLTWVALMDADIVLPSTFRKRLSTSELNPAKLYTCDRHVCDTPELWDQIRNDKKHLYHHQPYPAKDFLYVPPWDQVTKRLRLPLGYLQIAHYSGALGMLGYPTGSENANWSDIEFSLCYPACDRVWIEDLSVIHLGPTGMNAMGRGQLEQGSWS